MDASKPTSNISSLVSRLAQVCRFTSTVVHLPHHHHHRSRLNSHDLEDENNDGPQPGRKSDIAKEGCHPQPVKILVKSSAEFLAYDMLKLFELVSDFKVAYVQLQQAHIPYDPHRIEAADDLAVRRLEALCKIKRLSQVNQFHKTSLTSSASLLTKIKIKRRVLKSFKLQAKTKGSQILSLRGELLDLDLKNAELIERRVSKKPRQCSECLDFNALNDAVIAATKSVHDFAKPLISLIKASGWDLDRAANSVQDSVVYYKRCHKKYAFEAYISRRMFTQLAMDNQSIESAALRSDDPIEYLIREPCSAFAIFCLTKYMLVVHPNLELSFFGNLDHRTLVSSGKHPRTAFYQAFAKMARWFWVLQGVAGSITPKAVVYGVKRGTNFSDTFMDMVDEDTKGIVRPCHRHSIYEVAFMVMPGFRVGEKVIKSLVYCCQKRY
uniref:DUF641 domain-containing protein n=1 Tax=Kalanchoe fedtschenkoi TaxID=63787 RepID=A0A7N0TGK5_KALFE